MLRQYYPTGYINFLFFFFFPLDFTKQEDRNLSLKICATFSRSLYYTSMKSLKKRITFITWGFFDSLSQRLAFVRYVESLRVAKSAFHQGSYPGSSNCDTDVCCRIPINEMRPSEGTLVCKANGWFCKTKWSHKHIRGDHFMVILKSRCMMLYRLQEVKRWTQKMFQRC